MTDKEKLEKVRAEIEKTMSWEKEQAEHSYGNIRLLHECRESMCIKFLSLIDSTQEKSINNGLDLGCGVIWKDVEPVSEDLEEAIRKYEQRLEKENPATEAYDFASAIRFGANWQKQQMVAKAIDGYITFDYDGYDDKTYGCIAHDSFCLEDLGLKDKDKVKMIIIKED